MTVKSNHNNIVIYTLFFQNDLNLKIELSFLNYLELSIDAII